MATFSSMRVLISRLTFVALILTLIVMMVGCGSYTHVRKGLTTDPCWKESQQGQLQQEVCLQPVAESEKPQYELKCDPGLESCD